MHYSTSVGGSRIVFLDEPTSGMDPYSRRFTWNVIRQHREGRLVLLSSSFISYYLCIEELSK
jgi:ATP-binding cassette, subfamily A (ABC1), member 3